MPHMDEAICRVVVESPYAGTPIEIERNLRYLRAAMSDCLDRGEAPFASHALYTQPGVLDDTDPAQLEKGIRAGFAFRETCSQTVVYTDLGISAGMEAGMAHAASIGHPVAFRKLAGWTVDTQKAGALVKYWQSKVTALVNLLEEHGDDELRLAAYNLLNKRVGAVDEPGEGLKTRPLTPGMRLVLAERDRQIEKWSLARDAKLYADDTEAANGLVWAALGLLTRHLGVAREPVRTGGGAGAASHATGEGGWNLNKYAPEDRLKIAAALLIAEMDRQAAK